VCGAPNVPDAGGLVVLAPIGTYLPGPALTIERKEFAGVPSEGMLCSEAELGLGDDADGILVPPSGAAAGTTLSKAFPAARDVVLEIGVLPNRPDALGHIGLAREAAALFGVPFEPPSPQPPERERDQDPGALVSITIEDPERCPHYGGAVLVEARVAPSALEARWRLASLGVRPISNVVDVTNLVMLEYGHPLHAFDLNKVRGAAIVVRRARAGEKFRTLDGVERTLDPDDLVICDGEGPVALAGVMGGGDSEIGAGTQRVLLECAYFEPRGIRRASRRHGLHTESSHRFERGIDWGDSRAALARAASMVSRAAGATAFKQPLFVEAHPLARHLVALRPARLSALLGLEVEPQETRATLARLGFVARGSEAGVETWEVPSFRPDVAREVDLVEEVARVRGFETIPTTLPAIRPSRDAGPRAALARRARDAGAALGLSEAVTYAFVNPRDLASVGAPAPAVVLRNPLSEERSVMRTSHLPELLRALATAHRHGEGDVRLFAVGPVFLAPGASGAVLPDERLSFTALVAGERREWLSKPQPVDAWDAKGVAEGFVLRLVGRTAAVRPAGEDRPTALHPRGAAWIEVEGSRVGSMGPIHPDVAEAFDVAGDAVVVEFDLEALDRIGAPAPKFAQLPRFPASRRDLSVVVREDVRGGDVELAVREAAGALAEHVALFDRFSGGAVPPGHASLALHVVYRATDRTLTDAEVDAQHAQVVAAVEARFGATLRS
jgi:phenylalanyl-tRNA synthetase beta chain